MKCTKFEDPRCGQDCPYFPNKCADCDFAGEDGCTWDGPCVKCPYAVEDY